jgi:hypothetical protein
MKGFCEHCNEFPGFIEATEFSYQQNDYQLPQLFISYLEYQYSENFKENLWHQEKKLHPKING